MSRGGSETYWLVYGAIIEHNDAGVDRLSILSLAPRAIIVVGDDL